MQDRVPLRNLLREKEFWFLVLLGILYCNRTLFFGETFFFRDLYEHSIPQRRLLADILKSGELPLWDPYIHGGQPFLGNINNLALYPSGLLYLFFPLLTAFNLEITIHLVLCSISMYALSRVLGMQPQAGFLAGGIYGFCGITVSLINLLNRFLSFPYIPCMLLLWHLFLKERKPRWFVLACVAGTFQIFAGSQETSLLTFLLLLAWGLFFPYPQKSISKVLGPFLVLVVFIYGLASIQVLPTAEMVFLSSRPHHSYQDFTVWSLHLKRLPETIFSQFFGRTDALSPLDYWGRAIEGVPYNYLLSIYFGVASLVFAGLAVFSRHSAFPLSRAVRRFLAGVLLLAVVFALGRNLPGFHLVYEYVPLIHIFRYPSKLLFAAVLPVALLAGCYVQVHFAEGGKPAAPSTRLLVSFWILGVSMGVWSLLFIFSEGFSVRVQTLFFGYAEATMRNGLAQSFLKATGICLLVCLLYQYRRFARKTWQFSALVFIVVIDLFHSALPVNPSADRKYFTRVPQVAEIVQQNRSEGRLFRDEAPGQVRLMAPSNDVLWQNLWYLEVLNYYTGAYFRIPLIYHRDYDDLAHLRVIQLKSMIESVPWDQRVPVLSASSVSMVLTEQKFSVQEMPLIYVVQNPSNLLFYLYRNDRARPRVSFVASGIVVSSPEEAFKRVTSIEFDPSRFVVLENSEARPSPGDCKDVRVDTRESGWNHSVYSVVNECDGYLVFAEPLYPGWKVKVDGESVPVLRANYAFYAVSLPAGRHQVQRSYFPLSVWIGAGMSVLFALLLAGQAKSKLFSVMDYWRGKDSR